MSNYSILYFFFLLIYIFVIVFQLYNMYACFVSINGYIHTYLMCRTDRVTVVDTYQYDDSTDDQFEREPYCVKFRLHDTGLRPASSLLRSTRKIIM